MANGRIFNMTRGTWGGGGGTISGTVTINAAQAPGVTVLLFDRKYGKAMRETKTAADGSYSFPCLAVTRKYLVVALDGTATYNAEVADHLTAA